MHGSGGTASKTSLRLDLPEVEAGVLDLTGAVPRLPRGFSAVSKVQFQQGIEAFIAALDEKD